jgi:Mce-associated membrane protein
MTSDPETTPDSTETAVEISESSLDGADAAPSGETASNKTVVIRRLTQRCLANWRPIVVTALMVATLTLAAGLYFFQYRPDRHIDDAAARQAIRAASDGAVASLSYSPANMDRDFANAKSHLTGEFLGYYDKFTKELVTPMVKEKQISQTAAVVRAAVSELHSDSAVVLVFLNETTLSKDKPQPLTTPSSVRITLAKVNGSWLISKLEPFG